VTGTGADHPNKANVPNLPWDSGRALRFTVLFPRAEILPAQAFILKSQSSLKLSLLDS